MKVNDIRTLFFDFFALKGHKIVDSAPMVMQNDSTLMFTNAGMNQFKDIILGEAQTEDFNIANTQKCLRVSGKHNDLEEVGHDTYHHTMFEMLGSWSFGDYFKERAIDLAWEFLIEKCNLDVDRIYVTVFEGTSDNKFKKDNEAFNIWKKYLPENRILNGSFNDNFWIMGVKGPCGPCSEIHYDNRENIERKKECGSQLINKDHPQVIEIWNLVFMQFNQAVDGTLSKLSTCHVDTGMGLERLAMIMQGVKSNYDTDIFQPIIQEISKYSGIQYGLDNKQDIAMRVIADHIRAISFSIAEGQLPSNTKAGYVIRRILRRAVRYAYTFLNIREPYLFKLVNILVQNMGECFPELKSQNKLIIDVIKEEEESFLKTLELGLKRIEQIKLTSNDLISGKQVFELYDTFGFPKDLTSLILAESNMRFNEAEFVSYMQEQKERSKNLSQVETGEWEILVEDDIEEFVGYNITEVEVIITKFRNVVSKNNTLYQLVFNVTPFYPEGGGQVGDIGVIKNEKESIKIIDTKKENGLIIHYVDQLPKNLSAKFIAVVDSTFRVSCSRNHTATHLLHQTLRNILGDHVIQKGSLVNSKSLRFDFTHFAKIETSLLKKIEQDVNVKILQNIQLEVRNNLPLSQAKEMGAMMLFSEKYNDVVRMVQFDKSKELCGGTHVNASGEIGIFKIISEGSIASGIRRIEAITGIDTLNYFSQTEDTLKDISTLVKSKDLKSAILQLINSNKELEKKLAVLKAGNLESISKTLLHSSININGINLVSRVVDMDSNEMKSLSFKFRKEHNLIMVLASKQNKKALLTVLVSDNLIEKGIKASSLVKEIAKEIDGGGGGQNFFATAGGSKVDGIDKAINKAKDIVAKQKSQ